MRHLDGSLTPQLTTSMKKKTMVKKTLATISLEEHGDEIAESLECHGDGGSHLTDKVVTRMRHIVITS